MDVVVIGAGGHGRVVLEILRLRGEHTVTGFLDADAARAGEKVAGLEVLGPVNLLPRLRRQGVRGAIVAIGDNRVRLRYAQLVLQANLELINAVHPAAVVSTTAKIGVNVVVAAGAVVGTDATAEDSCIVNTSAVVDHECHLGPGVHICPGALLAGRVRIDEGAFVGLGAKILPCLQVGEFAVIGAGAVLLEDVPAQSTAVGVPARIIKHATPV